MKKAIVFAVLLIGLFFIVQSSFAYGNDQAEFEQGFIEGFKSVMGDMVMVPMIPMMPMIPFASNPYREGLKAGIMAGERAKNRRGY